MIFFPTKKICINLSFLIGVFSAFFAVNLFAQTSEHQSIGSDMRWLETEHETLATTGEFREFSLEGISSGPTTIAVTDDKTIWFTLSTGNAIGRMNSEGGDMKIFPLPNPDSSPRVMSIGADGNPWFSEHSGNRIGTISSNGIIQEFDIPTASSQPRAVALGADGNIWFGMFAGGKIGRVTQSGEITEFDIPTPNSGPRALAVGPDGNVWFSEFLAGKIGRITPQGDITEFDLPRKNAGPGDITAGADGAMWFIELSSGMDGFQTDGNRIGKITMEGEVTEFRIPLNKEGKEGSSGINLAVGPDKNIWFAKGASLWRVTQSGEMTEFPVTDPARTVGVSAGSDRQPPEKLLNRLWYTNPQGNNIGYFIFE